MGYAASCKNLSLWERTALVLCVANVGRGWETWLRPGQVKTEFQRVLQEEERGDLYRMTPVETPETQNRATKWNTTTSTWESPGATWERQRGSWERQRGSWGLGGKGTAAGFKAHPVEWQWPGITRRTHGKGLYQAFASSRKTDRGKRVQGDTARSNIWKSSSEL